jgi:hypothetical protein
MNTKEISLDTIMQVITKPSGKRRIIFDRGKIGGFSAKWYPMIFLLLPIVEFWIIFKTPLFEKLGIATAVVAYIIMLSVVMIIIYSMVRINNSKAIAAISSGWKSCFPEIDLSMLLGSGNHPYKEFFALYQKVSKDGSLSTQEQLQKIFTELRSRNSELIERMERSK